jgi:hypothetical protein
MILNKKNLKYVEKTNVFTYCKNEDRIDLLDKNYKMVLRII